MKKIENNAVITTTPTVTTVTNTPTHPLAPVSLKSLLLSLLRIATKIDSFPLQQIEYIESKSYQFCQQCRKQQWRIIIWIPHFSQ